jgi:catechol 2,3-dioxygenase-like lactoylglutathione lyase family enzyme
MDEQAAERPQFEGVHHVLVGVPPDQKAAAKQFYEEVLGFVPVASPLESGGSGNLWWYECGASELHVALVPDYQANVRPHVAIRVTDLPALRERLRRHGIETTLNYSYRGHWRIYVVDPWHNRLEFIAQLPPGVTPPGRDASGPQTA